MRRNVVPDTTTAPRIRPLDELDISAIVGIDERISGIYRPDIWEQRVTYYLRRDPECSQVAEMDGRVVGFMLADLKGGEFGLEEPTGWIERFGIDPDHRGRDLGKRMFEAILTHLRGRDVTSVRTLVDTKDGPVAGFLGALGFAPSTMQAMEIRL
jgi:ribosomal protein S18 acetylase RimI-like enzyme